MAHTSWKLIVTPLNADADAREAVVNADNWLSALRLARKSLGEEGGVPPGASCVMSATGEVTILDAVQRRRYFLARLSASVAPPAAAPVAPPAPAPDALASPPRKTTLAYSPAEAAAVRAQLGVAPTIAAPAPPASFAAKPVVLPGAKAPAQAAPTSAAGPAAPPVTAQPASKPLDAPAATPPLGGATATSPAAPTTKAQPAPRPDTGPLRKATMAYSPAESAAIREQMAKAQAGVADTVPPPAESPAAPVPASPGAARVGQAVEPAPPSMAAPVPAPGAPAKAAEAPALASLSPVEPKAEPAARGLPAPLTSSDPMKAPARRTTMAYSPEESASVRAQLAAAQAATGAPAPVPARPADAPVRTTTQAYSPNEAAAARALLQEAQKAQAGEPAAAPPPRKAVTVAYIESPFVGGVLLAIGTRDEEPTAESPLSYRERTYFLPDVAQSGRLESLLRSELERLQRELSTRPRGQFVSLAVFDHNFQGKPERPPVATLEWKDWRGEPVFRQSSSRSGAAWSAADGPVRTSFVPAPDAVAAAPVVVPVAAAVPTATVASPAPASALFTPATPRGANESWPAPSARDGTGEQDRRLAIAFEAVQDLYFLGTPAEGLAFAVKLLSELIPSEAVSGSVYDINTDEFRVVAATGPGADQRRAGAVPSSVGLLGAAMLSTKETFVVPDVSAEPRFDASVDGREGIDARNLLYLPLQKAEVWLGVLQLINRNRPRGFSEGDLAVAAYVAAQALEFLANHRQASARRRG